GPRLCPRPEGGVESDLRRGHGDGRRAAPRDPDPDEPRSHVLAQRSSRLPGPGGELGRHLHRAAREGSLRSGARIAAGGLPILLPAARPERASAAVKPGLEGGQELFRRNHWAEAREHLRSQWASIPEKDRPAASFLIGRSYAREAEFYRAVRRVGAEV